MTCKINISVQEETFDLQEAEKSLRAAGDDIGAIVSFTGYVRGEDGKLSALVLEHYPDMTKRELERIAGLAAERWPLDGIVIVHRFGKLEPGDPIVLVGAASRHRKAAFEAAGFIMDYLKNEAPFWKFEERCDGSGSWVAASEGDRQAQDRWQ